MQQITSCPYSCFYSSKMDYVLSEKSPYDGAFYSRAPSLAPIIES